MAVGISIDLLVKKEGVNADSGVYESFDGGESWKIIPAPDDGFYPHPTDIWFKDQKMNVFFFSSGGHFQLENNNWVFIKSNIDFIKNDLQPLSDSRESGWVCNKIFPDKKYDGISYNPQNGIRIEWGENSVKISPPISGITYTAIAKVGREDGCTIIYAVMGDEHPNGDLYKIIIPDEILENLEVLLP